MNSPCIRKIVILKTIYLYCFTIKLYLVLCYIRCTATDDMYGKKILKYSQSIIGNSSFHGELFLTVVSKCQISSEYIFFLFSSSKQHTVLLRDDDFCLPKTRITLVFSPSTYVELKCIKGILNCGGSTLTKFTLVNLIKSIICYINYCLYHILISY